MGRRTLVLIVALLLAGIAAFAVWQFLSNVEQEKEAELELRLVYRVAFAAARWPKVPREAWSYRKNAPCKARRKTRFLPANAIGSLEELTATLTGRVAAGPIRTIRSSPRTSGSS